jgi:hypothetical protein
MTVETLLETYGHHHPDFQEEAAGAYAVKKVPGENLTLGTRTGRPLWAITGRSPDKLQHNCCCCARRPITWQLCEAVG